MFAIFTKYHCPTNFKGARISARFATGGGRISVAFPYDISGQDAHKSAAIELIDFYNPQLQIVESADIDGGYVFIARQINQ